MHRHALFANAEAGSAEHVEQFRLLRRLARAQNAVRELGARHVLVHHDGEVAHHGGELRYGFIGDVRGELTLHCRVVQLGEVHLLFEREFRGDGGVQFAQPAHFLFAHLHGGGDPGMQEGFFRALEREPQPKRFGERLNRALDVEEIPLAPQCKHEVFALGGKLPQGQFLGKIDVRKLEEPARVVAAAHVAHDVRDHARRENGAHDGEVLADGIEDLHGSALGRVRGQAQKIEILG